MIRAIGVDIADLSRLKKVWQKHPERFLYRHFTPEEIKYCRAKIDPLESIAARFAAKEAFQKCWPENHGWQDVWVEMEGVKPKLKFSAKITKAMQEDNLVAHLSLSHDKDHAIAMVVLEELV
ncbi:MAG TPA: holo-[acyl-carrier-protein] synthase [Trueperaceae bacterium]|nr:holo-[acyl-carrier-protein] synthase [Trueperaceae bacterium]